MELLSYQLGEGVRAFSTLRSSGGQGEGAYASFNITHYCGDHPDNVTLSRAQLCRELNIADNRLFLPRQTHDNHVLVVDEAFVEQSAEAQSEQMEGIDALVTRMEGCCIGVSTADCLPVLLYDPVARVAAAAHAGWRGVVGGIAPRTIATMQALGAQADRIIATIGPSISLQSFEVGKEVAEVFEREGFPASIIDRSRPKPHIDLWAAMAHQCEECGLLLHNIRVAGVDTYTADDSFFSARRLGINSGRIFTGILLQNMPSQ